MQRRLFMHLLGLLLLFAGMSTAQATTTCVFNTAGGVMTLTADCTTDSTITIPNGLTLDGRNYTITAADPVGGHFLGAVVKNEGPIANVVNLRITTAGLSNACEAGDNGLRGILFSGVSGTIYGNTISNLYRDAGACPEGYAIEVRNFNTGGFDPPVQTVEITSNRVTGFQKTGIVCDGVVSCLVRSNVVGASATQAEQPVNGIQIGYGAGAVVENNDVAGNSWAGGDYYLDPRVSTAILLIDAAPETSVRHNNLMEGNADIGIYVYTDGAIIDNNRVYETGEDLNKALWDFGIYVFSQDLDAEVITTNTITINKVRGYLFPYNSPELTTQDGGNNKANPSPAPAK
ncbi:MAG: right-handed parallel beta-helix repeat-containing protein [Acidobacteria bacterium]|nr:right-handed parallel beta-helix repeat-containing protein [Acidobacteriota bacterium]